MLFLFIALTTWLGERYDVLFLLSAFLWSFMIFIANLTPIETTLLHIPMIVLRWIFGLIYLGFIFKHQKKIVDTW